MKKGKKDPFQKYYLQTESDNKHRLFAWKTAIGLQQVDGLTVSDYLLDVAKKNIDGDISYSQVQSLIESYYKNDEKKDNNRTKEADIVSSRISQLISENSFTFSLQQILSIHSYLFKDIYKFAGQIRNYNISKKEWVLDEKTIVYGDFRNLKDTIEYDLSQEKNFDYSSLTKYEIISHLARFISNIWQVHLFGEGNTRTIAVFLIKYLKLKGYDVTNDLFAENAWYFRNSLVRANYSDYDNQIYETTEYLELFLRNLLLNEGNELRNRYLHIRCQKPDIEAKKPDIEAKKPDIEAKKPDIDILKSKKFNSKTIENIYIVYDNLKNKEYFGRSDIIELLDIAPSSGSELINKLLSLDIIVPVHGHGKGKYRFK